MAPLHLRWRQRQCHRLGLCAAFAIYVILCATTLTKISTVDISIGRNDESIMTDLLDISTAWNLKNVSKSLSEQEMGVSFERYTTTNVHPRNFTSETTLQNSTRPAKTSTTPFDAISLPLRNPFDSMEDVIRMFHEDQKQAQEYISKYPTREFRFYVYNLTDHPYDWKNARDCVENKAHAPENVTRQGYFDNVCGFRASICNPIQQSADKYSSRRLNRNVDVVLSQLFAEYDGPLRTYDPRNATLFVVPYPSTAWFLCFGARKAAQQKTCVSHLETTLFPSLTFWNPSDPVSQQRHVFWQSGEGNLQDLEHAIVTSVNTPRKKFGGRHFVVPYVNTNREYQPAQLIRQQQEAFFAHRNYSLVSFMSAKISGNGQMRQEFMNRSQELIGDTLGGLPVHVSDMDQGRKLQSEQETLQKYRQSIFCPFFRGDSPNQKRFFDVIMSGCIPVAMTYKWSDEKGRDVTSYFAPGVPISTYLPFAKGSFAGRPEMGIDYSELVVEIDAECGLECMQPSLEALLSDTAALRTKQKALVKYAKVFSFGLEENAFEYVDAVTALMVYARHEAMAKTKML